MFKFEIELADPVIMIPTGKDTGLSLMVDVRKVDPAVRNELFRQGVIKPLTDISKDKDKEESWHDVHERRTKRRDNWYNGDFSVRGGGTADPISVQMKEEITQVFKNAGADMKSEAVKEMLKGTAAQVLQRYVAGQMPVPNKGESVEAFEARRNAEVEKLIAHYRGKAEATLASRRAAAAKIDVKGIKLL